MRYKPTVLPNIVYQPRISIQVRACTHFIINQLGWSDEDVVDVTSYLNTHYYNFISPANDISDSDPAATFTYAVEQLNKFNRLYIHVIEGAAGGAREVEGGFDLQILRRLFNGIYMANNG